MWYLTSAVSFCVGSDWANAQIFAIRAAIFAEFRMSSRVVSGTAGYIHLSMVAFMSSLAFSRHWSLCLWDNWFGGGGVYGGGDIACRKISVGESSEEWLMVKWVLGSRVDGDSLGAISGGL